MNKIVRTHYPVEKLPEDLRFGFSGSETVTIIVKDDDPTDSDSDRDAIVEAMLKARDIRPELSDDPVKRIRALRDEWDD
ncbi:MAG: hypothetical protein IOC90_00270 [Methylocystis sp.]|nr:hypothetical protein [Methylocystis sp.]MCA3583785.1 hypothetical protein [Methylocystis sp.]MCA3586458.1 hypothetical protein [Methylocystis sp.]MCA3589941.1 hypothetical protein [Methylocystis sp.]